MEEKKEVDRGTRGEAEFWTESTAFAKARGQETGSYISVWELLAVWSSWSTEQSARDQLGQPCRNGWGQIPAVRGASIFSVSLAGWPV